MTCSLGGWEEVWFRLDLENDVQSTIFTNWEDGFNSSWLPRDHAWSPTTDPGTFLKGRTITLRFCKVNGDLLEKQNRPYAVLSFATDCPVAATTVDPKQTMHIDTEDDNNMNGWSSGLAPNVAPMTERRSQPRIRLATSAAIMTIDARATALMRSWGSRPDTAVCDEPLYAHYLTVTGLMTHPGRDEIIGSQPTDWRTVVAELTGPIPDGRAVYYQKHMAHHLLPEVGREWLRSLAHAFLIRDPREMLLSLAKVTPHPTALDTGLPQQLELFRAVEERTGRTPPVVDARDVLEGPARVLGGLCAALGLDFTPAMLSWEPGLRPTDGIWAEHWYAEVARSTGFERWRPRPGELTGELARVHEECVGPYRELWNRRLT